MCDFNASKDRRHYYDMRRNYTHIIASYKLTGYEEGLKKGIEDGLRWTYGTYLWERSQSATR